jgi:hypothetical protein
LDRLSVDIIYLPDVPLYVSDKAKKPLPKPKWTSMISLIDGKLVRPEELDKSVVKLIQRMSKNFGLLDLKQKCEVSHYETRIFPEKVKECCEVSVQTCETEKDKEEINVSSISLRSEVFSDISEGPMPEMKDFLAGLEEEVEVEKMNLEEPASQLLLLQAGGGCISYSGCAKPSTKHPISHEDLEEIFRNWCHAPAQWIHYIQPFQENERKEEWETHVIRIIQSSHEKKPESDILHGEFEKDLLEVQGPAELKKMLKEFQDIFGALPEPGSVKKEVTMDLQLKPEWENAPLRGKCYAMSKPDAEEIEKQVEELLASNLVEEFTGSAFPKYCSPTFLVEKDKNKPDKKAKTKRMVGDYRTLKQRTVPHAGYLPDLEVTVEALAACKYKSKMDMRSGFWQVELTRRAQELSAFTIPSGRVFMWRIMPFGLSNAPGVFQELMMKALCQMKLDPEVRNLLQKGAVVSAFFDDVGVGSNTLEDNIFLLKKFFEVCRSMSLRVKLTKCEFLKEEIEYLGFEVGYGWWRPSSKKVEALTSMEIKDLKGLRSFLGACNFYRRHIKNFTESSVILTDLTKKDAKWEWTKEREKKFLELKQKICDVKCLGIPRPKGEIVIITDASDLGGGASIYQWQSLNPEEYNSMGETLGVLKDGTLKHTHEEYHLLVPLGHFNWKWNQARKNYATYEKELLAGVLTLASQRRILGHLPIVWLCDQEAVSRFARGSPPEKARQKRWWTFLSQYMLNIYHITGAKNELCDLLSRDLFQEKFHVEFEELAKEAFQRMDVQLDLRMEVLRINETLTESDYKEEFGEIWDTLTVGKPQIIEGEMYYKEHNRLYVEKKVLLPYKRIDDAIMWSHEVNGHPGMNRNLWFFLNQFEVRITLKELQERMSKALSLCRPCLESKPNLVEDRGLVGALPIPSMVNEVLYIDFTQAEEYAGHDYIMTIVDGLSRFAQFIPCKKKLDSEAAYQLLWVHWIQKYGKPK